MVDYNIFYRKYGVRTIGGLLEPVVIESTNIKFPYKTIFHWFKVSDIVTAPSTNIGYLKNNKKSIVFTVTDLPKDSKGTYKSKNVNINSVINASKKTSKGFKFIKPNIREIKLNKTIPIIYSYGALVNLHKYSISPLNEYYKTYNNLNSLVHNINSLKTDREHFILMDLPNTIPNINLLERFNNNLTRETLKYFSTYKHLIILELWKFFTPKYSEKSVFYKIDKSKLNNINLFITYDTKVSIVKLGLLYSIVKEYDSKDKLSQYPAKTVRKILFIYLNKILLSNINNDDIDIGLLPINKISDKDEIKNIDYVLSNMEPSPDVSDPSVIDDDEEIEKITDELVTSMDIDSTLLDSNKKYKTLNDIINDDTKQSDVLIEHLDKLREYKVITKARYETIKDILNKQDKLKSPYPKDKRMLKDLLTINPEELQINKEDITIPDSDNVLDKDMLEATGIALDKKYIENIYRKDLTSVIFSLQNTDIVVDNYNVNIKEDILGGVEEHSFEIHTLNGKKSTVKFLLPKIEQDGTFKMSGNTYILRKQRADLPIRKIDYNKVAISSYYGKLFITKAEYKRNDEGFWFQKELIKLYENNEIKNLVLIKIDSVDKKLPRQYGVITRYIKTFKYKNTLYDFDYDNRYKLLPKNIKLKDVEKNNLILIGMSGTTPVLMDYDSKIYKLIDNKYYEQNSIYEELPIDISNKPLEYASVKIYKTKLPLVLLLSYYVGFKTLLSVLKVKYTILPKNKRYSVGDNEYVVKFSTNKYIIEKDNGLADMILGGLTELANIFKNIDEKILEDRESFITIFTKLQMSLLYINEIKLLENMFIDPITKSLLETMKEPTVFKGLLIRASELLLTDDYTHPNNIDGMVIKGYERISGMMYKEMIKSIKEHNNKSFFGKSKININPYSVWKNISEDSTTVLVDDLNPIAAIKQIDDVTYLGAGGRNKDSMSKKTRMLHVNDIGVISEATKDSGDVGIAAYLTANPNITTLRGNTRHYDPDKDSVASVVSISSMLLPYSTTDDVKRNNFASVQNSHIIPIANMMAPYVRTGYESIIPYRSGPKYIIVAEDNGKVIAVTKTKITIVYLNTTTDSYNKTYSLKEWMSKEEAGSCYTHKLVTNLKPNQIIKKGDIVAYDNAFFEPDIFSKNRVIYKSGMYAVTMLQEINSTYEDSSTISSKLSNMLKTNVTKVKSIIVDSTDNILKMVKPGDRVEPSDILFTITDSSLGDVSGLDKETVRILQNIKSKSPKAKTKGTINKIKILYNDELVNISKTLRSLIKESDSAIQYEYNKKDFTGRVNSSYSINGKPLLDGKVEIKIYIDTVDTMGVGDKCIFGNQLKSTIGEVFTDDIKTESGLEIEAQFSYRAISARIVNSPIIVGSTARVLDIVAEKAIAIYKK